MQTLERFQGKGRAVLTASDATQYAFEGDDLRGSGTTSVFTRYLVEAISSGAADLDEDGDIALDELYSYVYEKVVAELPQQRPKKQEDVDGRILIARNVHWTLPAHLRHAIESPIAAQRLSAVSRAGPPPPRGQRRRPLGRLRARHHAGRRRQPVGVGRGHSVARTDRFRDRRTGARRAGRRRSRGLRRWTVPAPRQEPVPEASAPASPAVPVVGSGAAAAVRPAAGARSGACAGVAARPRSRPEPATAAGPPMPPRVPPWRDATGVVLGLVVLSALPLALSRFLAFEASYPNTADEFSESTVPWTLIVVLPLVAAAGLLLARRRLPQGLPVAFGLVLGAGLVLAEHASFWVFFFIENEEQLRHRPGPVGAGRGSARRGGGRPSSS